VKFIHTSDFHLSKNLRLQDYVKSLTQIRDFAITNKVEFVIVSGDIYDKHTPDNEARVVFKQWLYDLMKANIFIFILLGTHDEANVAHALQDINIYGFKNIVLMDKVDIYNVDWNGCKLSFLAVPHVSKGKVSNPQQYIIEKIQELKGKLTEDRFNIFTGHFTTTGALNSSGYSLDKFDEVVVPKELLIDTIFNYVALGHIHKEQTLCMEPPVIYAGGIERKDFGERDNHPQFVYYFQNFDGSYDIQYHPLQVRPMRQWNINEGDSLPICEPGEIVKLIIKVKKERVKNICIPEIVSQMKMRGAYSADVELDIEKTLETESEIKLKDNWSWGDLLRQWLEKEYKGNISVEEITKELVTITEEK